MKNPNERARSNMYQHNESFLKRRQKMRCATKTLSNSTSTSSGAVLCRRRRRFPLFLFLLLNEWMKNITRFDSLLFIWTPFYVLCAFFFWHLIFLKKFWRSLKFEFLKIPHFFAKKTSQNQNRFRRRHRAYVGGGSVGSCVVLNRKTRSIGGRL